MLFMKLGAPVFGEFIFSIVLFSWLIDILIVMKCPLFLLVAFSLRYILLHEKTAVCACSWSICLESFSPLFHFKMVPIFQAEFLV